MVLFTGWGRLGGKQTVLGGSHGFSVSHVRLVVPARRPQEEMVGSWLPIGTEVLGRGCELEMKT